MKRVLSQRRSESSGNGKVRDVDSNETMTTVSERISSNANYSPAANTGFTNPGDAALFSSGVTAGYNAALNLSLSGLDPDATYNLIIYTTSYFGDDNSAHLTALYNRTTIDYTPAPSTQGTYITTTGLTFADANYLEYDNMSGAYINSTAVGISSSSNASYFSITGFQLVLVSSPEPSTWAMMLAGLGMLGFCFRRKSA